MWLLVAAASAHEPGLSRLELHHDRLSLQVARVDASDPARLLDGTTAAVDGRPCALTDPDVRPDDNGFLATATLDCPPGEQLRLEAGWFDQLPPGHRTVVERDGEPTAWLDRDRRTFGAERPPSAAAVARGYLVLGVEHILTGWDHLAFLAGLLLVARSLRAIAAVVTGFTLSHSLTLSLAALGWVQIPPALVEPAIAATIVYVGLENLSDPPERRRFALTFVLGLIHGLGFAGLLSDIGLPIGQVPLALATFNLGVELGQLGVVAVVLPALLALRRTAWWPGVGVRAGSLAVAAMGAFWLFDRL